MKHRFLLDINILYHAVRGVNEFNDADWTSADLLRLIGQNCHRLVVNSYLFDEYLSRLRELFAVPVPALPPLYFLNQLLLRAEKFQQELAELPELPHGVIVPAEDVYLVRCALVSHPIVVAADHDLVDAIRHNPLLELQALYPSEAIALAQNT